MIGLMAYLTTAIDIALYAQNNCKGISAVWQRVGPNKCVGVSSSNAYRSAYFSYIPTNWDIQARAYKGGNCRNRWVAIWSNGNDDICVTNGATSGAGYGFSATKKRNVLDEASEDATSSEDCRTQPDLLNLVDGTSYRVTSMDNATFAELVSLAMLSPVII
jgi:hypothetical protein